MIQLLDIATILIIDDTPSNLGLVVNLFESNGYRVVIAQDGEEGLRRTALVMPDLILLDIMMPGVDGFEICRKLKAQELTRHIPVIFMTSLASVEHKVKGFQAGAVDYLTKPLQIDEVMARVNTHLNLHAAQKKLAEQNVQLEKHRAELEMRVAERTAELAASEREFRTLAESLPDNLARYDTQGRIVYMNSRLEAFLGYSFKEKAGKRPLERSGGDTFAEYQAHLEAVIATGQPSELELAFSNRNEGICCHHIRFIAERDEQGEIVGALTIGRDITMMKTIENELKEREQRYREIFDNAVEGMYLLEVTEDGRFRNIDINPALAASTGIAREAMIGRFVDDTVSEEVGRLIVEKYRRVVDHGKTLTESIELDLPSGKRCYYSTITPIYYDGRIHRLIGISRDISELKRAECELEESRTQLRGLVASREATREEERKYIAREVHDELGQVLTGLQLNISVLKHRFATDTPMLLAHLKDTMMLTDRALAVARNVATALRPASLDMGIVSALEWLADRFGSNTGINCQVYIEDKDICLDEVHAIALFRIVQESLTNISRHARADQIEIRLSRDRGDYVLKVRDNGAGFDASAKKENSFGLLGIRERVQMLGGKLVINSQPGYGTEIDVHMPVSYISSGEA